VVTRPAVSLAQDRESTPAEPVVLTTMLRITGDGSTHIILVLIFVVLYFHALVANYNDLIHAMT